MDKKTRAEFALFGGKPVYSGDWPAWPRSGMYAQKNLLNVLHGGRWSISVKNRTEFSYEKSFSDEFSDFIGRRYGVPCNTGSAALRIALLAMGVGAGDEVIVPGLTWASVASSVLHIGAKPVYADISEDSLTLNPESIKKLVNSNTRAVIAAHMYSSRADIDAISEICRENKIYLIEDASQAHGGYIGDRRIGTFGDISIFSMQQTKLLTSGEGGIALTDNDEFYEKLQRLRADGRTYGESGIKGYFGLNIDKQFLGQNLCMSEFHAAILLEGLRRLDLENRHRLLKFQYLCANIKPITSVRIITDNLKNDDGRTFYKIPLTFIGKSFEALGSEFIAKFLTSELNLLIEPLDYPLNRHPLLGSQPKSTLLPISEKIWQTTVYLPHYCLLGIEEDIDIIIKAVEKLAKYAEDGSLHA